MYKDKFPRIPHLPWSPGGTRDDRRLTNDTAKKLFSKEIIITEKIDGSNLCITRNEVFARSHSGSPSHPSFDLAKSMHSQIAHIIPENIAIFGEWCFAVHSIEYDNLPWPFPFLVFGIRDNNGWYYWKQVEDMANILNLNAVPVLFFGIVEKDFQGFTETLAIGKSKYGEEDKEGLVIWPNYRLSNDIDFSSMTAKWVKKGHPKNPDEHWQYKPMVKQIKIK